MLNTSYVNNDGRRAAGLSEACVHNVAENDALSKVVFARSSFSLKRLDFRTHFQNSPLLILSSFGEDDRQKCIEKAFSNENALR